MHLRLRGGVVLLCEPHMGFKGHKIGFMTVEEEIELLEKGKKYFETQLKNINDRLNKLKA